MNEQELERYIKAGKIAAEVLQEGLKKIQPNAKLLDVANFVEDSIRQKGAKPAFPCNISVNEIAAHYSPQAWDESTFKRGDMVKLDVGVHVEGCIGDTAKTIVVGGEHKLIAAVEKGLERAIEVIEHGVRTDEIGEAIESAIKSFGFLPVSNLTGHQLSPWNLHGGELVPNIKTRHGAQLKEGDVFAIEPFATNGAGRVVDDANAIIFRCVGDAKLRMKEARDILEYAKANYGMLPFAERWIAHLVPRFKLNQALRQLVYSRALHAYHILKEKDRGLVAQAEHTVIVTKDGCEVTTKI